LPPPPKSLTVSSDLDSLTEQTNANLTLPDQPESKFGYGCNNRLDEQLMKLKREMAGLRQLDLSLLSQLNALWQSINEYKSMLNGDEEVEVNGHEENGVSNHLVPRSRVGLPDDLSDDESATEESESQSSRSQSV